ncbi:MAG: YdiU family protein, partial [Polyangiaceae bacterium]|nr:YdiU family protein [Polyangiaceae bacterium]
MTVPFQSRFVSELPGDKLSANRPRQVEGACYSLVEPTPVAAPKVIAHSQEVADQLGYSSDDLESARMSAVLGGCALQEGMTSFAAAYGGHQFGNWAGQLGDGRAISLGERQGPDGNWLEMQLKGAGPTPYSRTADGRAVMRSSVREFLCSEAMFHLGVPTTRALSLVSTGDAVVRDVLYDGNAKPEPGAIVCRVAPSFLRFGNFELFASRGDETTLRQLTNYTLRHFFPQLLTPEMIAGTIEPGKDEIAAMFSEVCLSTAIMVNHWMRVGFVHGVMNTDNMSILGLTIDYGPYGWLEDFDPTWTPNTT